MLPREQRLAVLAALAQVARVRVTPTDDAYRALRHPRTGTPFPATGSVGWPLDRYTLRRVLDGSLTIEPTQ
jgi:hypothetical protein